MTRIRMGLVPGLLLALALAVAACGGGGGKSNGVASLGDGKATATTSPGGSSDPKQGALAFGRCMRQHGIDMADPEIDADGGVAMHLPPGVGPDSPKLKAAEQACNQYLPNGGQPPKVSPQQQQLVAYASCMRQQGINIADPKPGGGIHIDGSKGVDPGAPKFKAADQACKHHLPDPGKQPSGGGGK
jgi:hypothetical protein